MAYDLLIKGGHVLDPAEGLDGALDIGISGGTIAAIRSQIGESDARRVLKVQGANRHVLPGLVDIHTHIAYGAQTPGVGLECVEPDVAGVHSGCTTVLDCGSVGAANVGVFASHLIPRSKSRIIVYLNVGSYANTIRGREDVARVEDIDPRAIARCIEANPGLISGFKLRMIGRLMHEQGEEIVRRSKDVAREHHLPLMVHIGNSRGGTPERMAELTRFALNTLTEGDILTHLCTPHPGGVMDRDSEARQTLPELQEARTRGVILDPAPGRHNFLYEIARRQAQMGLHPDTISSDITFPGRTRGVGLLDTMSKFLILGYSLADVVRMASANAARAIGMQHQIGAIAVGREADLSIVDEIDGDWQFTDTHEIPFVGHKILVPVQTIRAGELFSPDWGPYPWGWLPEAAPGTPAHK